MKDNTLSTCRICGSGRVSLFSEATSEMASLDSDFFECESCGSLLDSVGVPYDYKTWKHSNPQQSAPHIKFHLEVGAGILPFAQALCLIRTALSQRPPEHQIRLLDVGAGVGFALSVAQTLKWEATGLEPSDIGLIGSQLLGVHIIPEYLNDAELPEQHFDVFFSAETIEHVSSPDDFVESALNYITDDGLLYLATPNSEVLRQCKTFEKEWEDALSPGAHMNILSSKAMRLILERHGFEAVKIFYDGGTSGKKTMHILARRHGMLPESLDWDQTRRAGRELVNRYLRDIVALKERRNERDIFYGGVLFRLLEHFIGDGHYDQCMSYANRLEKLLQSQGIDQDTVAHLQAESFDEYVSAVPAYLGKYYFHRGILSLNYTKNYEEAVSHFDQSARLFRIEQKLPYFPGVGWVERARFHTALALLYMGSRNEAIRIFDELLECPEQIPTDILDSIQWNRGTAQLQLGDNLGALKSFAEFLLKQQSRIPSAYHQPAIHMIMALGQIVEGMGGRIDSANHAVSRVAKDLELIGDTTRNDLGLLFNKLGALEIVLRQTADAYQEDRKSLRKAGKRLVTLAEDTSQSVLRLIGNVEPVISVLSSPFKFIRWLVKKPHELIGQSTRPWDSLLSPDGTEMTVGQLVVGRKAEQLLTCTKENFRSVRAKMGTFSRSNSSTLQLEILDRDKNLLREVLEFSSSLRDNQPCSFSFEPIENSKSKSYWARFSSPDAMMGNAVTIWATKTNEKTLTRVDGKKLKGFQLCVPGYAYRTPPGDRDILIITPDTLGNVRIGLGMRHWEIASALANHGLKVTLATCQRLPADLQGEGFNLREVLDQGEALQLAGSHRFLMVQGDVLERYPALEEAKQRLIVDLVTPIHIESMSSSQEQFERTSDLIQKSLRRGHFFICGNERQRIYWLGMLTAMGRLRDETRKFHPELRYLVDVVGFGIRKEPPSQTHSVLKDVRRGIEKDDFVLLWFGGIWDWFDPLTLINAVKEAHQENDRIKLFFSNYRRPNGEIPIMAERARQRSIDLGILDRCVFFNEFPIPFSERANYLVESDVGVICQAANFETQISARTRILDFIWAGLPILMNDGDEFGEIVRRDDLGIVVDNASVDPWKTAILELANSPEKIKEKAANLKKVRSAYLWARQVEPLVRYLHSTETDEARQ